MMRIKPIRLSLNYSLKREYEAEAECLLARKRPRNAGEKSVWAFHTLTA